LVFLQTDENNLTNLPDEILLHIFRLLTIRDLGNIKSIHPRLNTLITENNLVLERSLYIIDGSFVYINCSLQAHTLDFCDINLKDLLITKEKAKRVRNVIFYSITNPLPECLNIDFNKFRYFLINNGLTNVFKIGVKHSIRLNVSTCNCNSLASWKMFPNVSQLIDVYSFYSISLKICNLTRFNLCVFSFFLYPVHSIIILFTSFVLFAFYI
jgi:hypothetical protein